MARGEGWRDRVSGSGRSLEIALYPFSLPGTFSFGLYGGQYSVPQRGVFENVLD